MNSKKNILQIVCWALTAPPVAGRSSQAASDSNAASRQQTQKNNIASSDPRLVKNAPVGGPFFCELRPATCELRLFHESVAAERRI